MDGFWDCGAVQSPHLPLRFRPGLSRPRPVAPVRAPPLFGSEPTPAASRSPPYPPRSSISLPILIYKVSFSPPDRSAVQTPVARGPRPRVNDMCWLLGLRSSPIPPPTAARSEHPSPGVHDPGLRYVGSSGLRSSPILPFIRPPKRMYDVHTLYIHTFSLTSPP